MKGKGAVAGSLVVVFLALVLLNFYDSDDFITGYVVRSSGDVLIDVQVVAADNSLKVLGAGAKLCVVVEMDDNMTYYYELVKSDGSIVPQYKYCADPSNDAVIIKFNSYDDFAGFKADPSGFLVNKRNTGYYLFPSKYVESGGAISCTEEFQQRYCGAAYYYWNEQQQRDLQLDCCANYFLPESIKNEIETLKKGRVEAPATMLNLTNLIITVLLLGVLVALVLFLVLKKKKPETNSELKEYVESCRMQGYTDDQIRGALAESGWEEKDINNILGNLYK